MTGRAVIKRMTALWKYRKAIEDMNKYVDATETDITREDTCIICREQMRPWNPGQNPAAVQRVRPKKLPCGHILHMGCLKSWLERQQVCPTCRRSVVLAPNDNSSSRLSRPDHRHPAIAVGAGQQPRFEQDPGDQQGRRTQAGNPNGDARVSNLGNSRVGFAQGLEQSHELTQPTAQPLQAIPPSQPSAQPHPATDVDTGRQITQALPADDLGWIRDHLVNVERTIRRHFLSLQHDHRQLQVCNLLFAELQRIHQQRQHDIQWDGVVPGFPETHTLQASLPSLSIPNASRRSGSLPESHLSLTRHGIVTNSMEMLNGGPQLSESIVIPPGWSLLPLQRLDGVPVPAPQSSVNTDQSVANGRPTSSDNADLGLPALTGPMPRSSNLMGIDDSFPRRARTIQPSPTVSENQDIVLSGPEKGTSEHRIGNIHPAGPNLTGLNRRGEGHESEIIAPNPVLPNWGSENQIFRRGSLPPDDVEPGSLVPKPPNINCGAIDETPTAGTSLTGLARDDSFAETKNQIEDKVEGNGKGKGKAVTIEDAEDNDN